MPDDKMPGNNTQDSFEADGPQWELPEDQAVELGRDATASFSLVRVAVVAGLAMLVIAPAVYVLEAQGLLSESRSCAFPTQGSATRFENPFDLSNSLVPEAEIRSGGPPKDGIPALSAPQMIVAEEADYLQPNDRVIGVVIDGQPRAYPLAILNYHEIVNDRVGEQPFAVSYCPLCDSASVFSRRVGDGECEFGVSGLLYNSNVLMYDRDEGAESLWSQIKNEAIAGPVVESRLELMPLELTTWQSWQERHPTTSVLSSETGHQRNYTRNPYADYFATDALMFPVKQTDDRLPNKQRVLGVFSGGQAKAYPLSAFSAELPRVEDEINGQRIVVEYDPQSDSLRVLEADEDVTWMYSLWFSWYAMHPETAVYAAPVDD